MIKTTRDELEYIRLRFPNEETIDKELELTNKLEEYLINKEKEELWCQNSRELWLKYVIET